jgi:hypothetical protein
MQIQYFATFATPFQGYATKTFRHYAILVKV